MVSKDAKQLLDSLMKKLVDDGVIGSGTIYYSKQVSDNLEKISNFTLEQMKNGKKDDVSKIDTFMKQLNESVLVFVKEFDIKLED